MFIFRRSKLTPMILILVIFLFFSGPLLAICDGFTQIVDGNGTVYTYNENNKLVHKAWLDANGKFHEKYYSCVQLNDDNDPWGDIRFAGDDLLIPVGIDAANVAIYELATGNPVWDNGGPVAAQQELIVPNSFFNENLHMIATLNMDGKAANVAMFKVGTTCSGALVIQ